MSKIKQIREAIDNRLDRWDARLDALEAQIEHGEDEVMERVQQGGEKLAAAADRVKETLEDAADLTADETQELRSDLDELRVQLALGKAESRDAFEAQRKKFRHALHATEEKIDSLEDKFEDKLAEEVEGFVRLADRLKAEFEAAELQFALLKADQRDTLQQGGAELRHKIAELKATARRQRDKAGDQLEVVEETLAAGVDEFRNAFRRLIGG